HPLGIVKNFSGNRLLKHITPDYFSAAWVRLGPGQELGTHRHDTDSMIIVTNGSGRVIGDLQQALSSGDTVYVPAGCHHGFQGAEEGFWALSIQFEKTSLYENLDAPRVHFISEYDRLLRNNDNFFFNDTATTEIYT